MSIASRAWLGLFVLCTAATVTAADPPELPTLPSGDGPTNGAVLLPPQFDDPTAKVPNHTREKKGEWTVYGGVYFLQPVFETNPAFVISGAGGNVSRQVDFGYSLDVAPAVWIGYVSERGWGVRGRWFMFDHDSSANHTTAPGETVTGMSVHALGQVPIAGAVSASSKLAIQVVDFQGTCTFDGPRWSHLLGIGVRYTHMNQDYHATLANAVTQIDLASSHTFNSAGPSFSFETKRRIRESGFSIYGQLHAAILFGNADESYTAINNGTPQAFTRSQADVLPVGEIEVGAEYCHNIGRARLFLQAGFAGQAWLGGGNASNVDPIGPSSASNNNFGLVGLALRAGVRY